MWQDFFEQQQIADEQGKTSTIASIWNSPDFHDGFFSTLTEHGLLLASGNDAANFLHNQLSNDVEHLGIDEVRRAAYCTVKGRMLASFVYWKTEAGIVLQTNADIQAGIQKRLQMFVLRAKVTLQNMNDTYLSLGLGGRRAAEVLHAWFPELPVAAYAQVSNQHGTLIRFTDVLDTPRYQWVCPVSLMATAWDQLQQQLRRAPVTDWNLSEIQAGIAHVNGLTQEKFVPQMINFELIGGVNFRKGCYPGQEIVARSQYLGKLKRRMALARIPATGFSDGMEIFNEAQPDQPCGVIVNVQADSPDSSLALVEMTLADQEVRIHCTSADGPLLQLLPLPYEIKDITR